MADLVPSLQLLGVGGLAEDPPSSLAVPGTWTIGPEQRRVASTMLTLELHPVLHLPRKVTLELHQILRLTRKMSPMLDPRYI